MRTKVIEWDYENGSIIKGFDLISKSEYNSRIKEVTKNTDRFLIFGQALNKGTLRSIEYLASINFTKEEKTAL